MLFIFNTVPVLLRNDPHHRITVLRDCSAIGESMRPTECLQQLLHRIYNQRLLLVSRAVTLHKRRVQVEWWYFLRHAPDKSLLQAFTVDEIYQALQNMKAGTAPGCDHVHPEFLKNLGPRAQTWLLHFFSRIIIANAIPKIWRKTKVIATEKPGKDTRLEESYRPISLLSTSCYKLLERLLLRRVSPEIEKLLGPEQAGFRRNRST